MSAMWEVQHQHHEQEASKESEGTHDFNTMLAFFFNMQSNMSLYFILILYTAQILSVLHLLKIKLQCNKNRLTNE